MTWCVRIAINNDLAWNLEYKFGASSTKIRKAIDFTIKNGR